MRVIPLHYEIFSILKWRNTIYIQLYYYYRVKIILKFLSFELFDRKYHFIDTSVFHYIHFWRQK